MAYLVWRRNRYAEILHTYRTEEGKVRQVQLAYLGRRPVITDGLKARLAREHPYADIDWDAIQAEIDRKIGNGLDAVAWSEALERVEEELADRTAAVLRPTLWAYFEARRRAQHLGPDEPMIWEREPNDPPPRRKPSHSDREGQEKLWPIFRRMMEARPDLLKLIKDPERMAEATRRAYNAAESELLRSQEPQKEPTKPTTPAEPKKLGYDEALRILGLPYGQRISRGDVEEAYRAAGVHLMNPEDARRYDAAQEAAEEYVRRRAWL